MLAALVSDSHDNLQAVEAFVKEVLRVGVERIIHAGDFVAPFSARPLADAGIPVTGVYGNNDGEREGLARTLSPAGTIADPPAVFRIDGLKTMVVHDILRWRRAIDEEEPDLLIHGHTHRPEVLRRGRALVVNPGELGGWLTGRPTWILFDTADTSARIMDLEVRR